MPERLIAKVERHDSDGHKLGMGTWISIKLLIALAPLYVIATGIYIRFSRLEDNVSRINSALDTQWRIEDQAFWQKEMEHSNPTLKIPDVRDILKYTRGSIQP